MNIASQRLCTQGSIKENKQKNQNFSKIKIVTQNHKQKINLLVEHRQACWSAFQAAQIE